ncbi:MAG: N,N-dimethylformamidase beta subunit family domain-containing protein, partial [Pirellulaceae bacterium]
MTRRLTLLALVWFGFGTSCLAAQSLDAKLAKPDPDGKVLWYDIVDLGVEGQGWRDTLAPFDRLPGRAQGSVREAVWGLSRQSAGLCVRFVTDARSLKARWTVTRSTLAMPHMAATGVSGLDLYMRSDSEGTWRWVAVGQPREPSNTVQLVAAAPPGKHEWLLYLPLYNGVQSVEVGIPPEARLEKAPPYPPGRDRPVVFYGTSITQGGCASRPGMVHTAILQRRLNCPVINLGFSGNGRMELPVVDLLAEIDAAVYVIDCLPNMPAAEVTERTEPLVRRLRAARPLTPILLVEDRSYSDAWVNADRQQRNTDSRQALWDAYQRLLADGVGGLHYLPGERLLGTDRDDTVDGSHPTDLGFQRHADAFEPVLRNLLPQPVPDSERAPLEAYTSQVSYRPGEEIAFHVSSSVPQFDVEIARLGAERQVVWQQRGIAGERYPVPHHCSSHGCGWPVGLKVQIPSDWRTGYYVARLSAPGPDGKPVTGECWFILRASRPGQDSKILLQLSTNTYNAYTNWGGYSLYAYNGRDKVQGRRVSYNRPVRSQFSNWELPFVQWAESHGFALDYAANTDLEFHPELLASYRLVLSVGHDEYWSAPMRDHLEAFIERGGNVAFFSGNTCCWQVRSEEAGRALTCWKQESRQDPYFDKGAHRLLSSLWSHHLVSRPENSLTGVGFLWGGYHRSHGQFMDGPAAFTVHRPDHWLFAGTQLKRGDAFGGKDTIVGYECDGCELTTKDGLPVPTFRDGTPQSFEVLATCPARWHPDDSEWYERWEKGRTGNAVLGIYQRGGTVVTTGSTDWAHGLRGKDPAVEHITRNVL